MMFDVPAKRPSQCLWALYVRRSDGTRYIAAVTANKPSAERAKALFSLDVGETATLIRYDREDRKTIQNNGGSFR